MKLLIALVCCTLLEGCAAYTVATAGSYIATDRTLTDHAATLAVPHAQCSSAQVFKGKYWCEIQDPSVTYNRSSY